jgi:hypothetical protein
MAECEHWREKKPNIRSSGCRLLFGGAENGLLAIALPNSSTIFRHAVRAIQGAYLVLYLVAPKMRCAYHFI